ncbi:siphovirus ReqiPepy6 Gp37-like family protein [Streptomyces sp. Tu6071]|uniref:siphovirus ReqiPepy6 Gp37-like family protein n=1 Tax=Streptomyces sp. Tu6071 TaxID=355249 RepID=UPI001F39954A|nr:siphovirus ReqiPepy6 Gp37-like family protein [Streptomyces sp. Tu6071]
MRRIGEIDEWISLDFTVRLCEEGSWQLLIKAGTTQAELIQKGGGIVIWQDGVNTPLLSGQVDTFQLYWTTVQHTGPGSVYIAGKCHNTLAYRRLAFPDPSRSAVDQWKSSVSSRAIPASTAAAKMIYDELNKSIGPGAVADRRVAGLNLQPSSLTNKGMADTLRFDEVGEKLATWYDTTGVAYRLIYNAETQLIDLVIFQPRDLSKSVRLSPELGNLREYIWTVSAPKVTRAIVGCDGENQERYYYQKIDTASEEEWGLQIETFVDRRDIQLKWDIPNGKVVKSDSEMTDADFQAAKDAAVDAATSALSEGEKNGNFQIYPIDTETCLFGRDYFVGDRITVAINGVEYVDVVREVTISVDDGGNAVDVHPKIGEQGSGEPLNLYATVDELRKKLRRLEARM